MRKPLDGDKAIMMAAFARMDVTALAVALGSVFATGLFLATVVLLLKGPPPRGMEIGPHLGLLAIYLPGYSVTWAGSIIGSFYAWILGAGLGFVLAVLWNLTHYLYIALIAIRAYWWHLTLE